MSQSPLQRIVRKLNQMETELPESLSRLSPGQLSSLLLAVFQKQTQAIAPHQLLQRFKQNRFVQPGSVNPIELKRLEIELLETAQSQGFEAIELSPVVPLGSCSVYGKAHQNKILSALRGCEVLADPSNMLTLILIERWLQNRSEQILRLATTQRCLRPVKQENPQFLAHFGMLALVSLVPSRVPDRLAAECFKHLDFYAHGFQNKGLKAQRYTLTQLPGPRTLQTALAEAFQAWKQDCEIQKVVSQDSGQYYLAGRIQMDIKDDNWLNLADCGIVTWPAVLSGYGQVHAVISGLGLERTLSLLK